jgi:putative two-component system response regulator
MTFRNAGDPAPLDRAVSQGRILIVDDEEENVMLLERLLDVSGFINVASTTDSSEVVALCAKEEPDLLLLDLQMPRPDGFEVMSQLEPWTRGATRMPILVLTADSTRDTKTRALSSGASDFLNKPFDTTEVVLRVRNLLLTRVLSLELRDQNLLLERRVRERTRALEEARLEIVDRLALAADYRDDSTGAHARRVGRIAALLGRGLELEDETVELLQRAAPLHDIGHVAVSDSILLKHGKLSPEEFEVMKLHTTVGGEILGRSRSELLRMSEEIALSHHEWWDGSGYPSGLKGEEIPLSARITAVADVLDTLMDRRPYKAPWSPERALAEIDRLRGRQFDPQVVDALHAALPELLPQPAAGAQVA